MTKQEALQKIKYMLFIYKDDNTGEYLSTGHIFRQDFEAIEYLLKLVEGGVNND